MNFCSLSAIFKTPEAKKNIKKRGKNGTFVVLCIKLFHKISGFFTFFFHERALHF